MMFEQKKKFDTEGSEIKGLGSSVLSYLYNQYNKPAGYEEEADTGNTGKINRDSSELYRFVKQQALTNSSRRDDIPVSRKSGELNEDDDNLVISNLLPSFRKRANVGETPWQERQIGDLVDALKAKTKSPLVLDALIAAPVALTALGVSSWLNPTNPKSNPTLAADAQELMEDDINKFNGRLTKSPQEYLKRAIAKKRWNNIKNALIAGGLVAGTSAWLRYIPGKPESLWKWNMPKTASMNKKAFGPLYTPFGLQQAVNVSGMSPYQKNMTNSMISTMNQPLVDADDVINHSVYSGASGVTGMPLGGMALAAAADAGVGYGVGKLFGIDRPDRLAAAAGIGSFLYNAYKRG